MTKGMGVENQLNFCGLCNERAERKCSGCQTIFYCSREHQKLHWKQHIKQCTPFKMCENSVLGRHYIATRKINAGEIIIEELQPLISAPLHDTHPLCLNCFASLDITNAQPCKKCGWPLCNKCDVHGGECEFTIKHRDTKVSITDFQIFHPTYKCIGVVRALALRESDLDNYEKFMSLQSHSNDNKIDGNDEKIQITAKEEFYKVARFVKEFFKLDNNIKLEDIVRILGILQINGHEVPTTENAHMAVFNIASYFEHNCHANCSKSFTENGGIIIRAAETILKGQHLTLCYTDPLWGIANRRHHLWETKFFYCKCDRCCDPTEFGTMFNAIKCTNGECRGASLPSTFITEKTLNSNTNEKFPNYVCTKCNKTTMTWNSVENVMESIGIELATMAKDNIDACRQFIERNSTIIHENHFYIIDVELALVQLIGQKNGGLAAVDDQTLNEKIRISKKLDQLLRSIVPAENRLRGLILFELHAGLAEYGRRQPKHELRGILKISREALIKAHELLRYEPVILPEGRIAQVACQNIDNIDAIIRNLYQFESNPV